MADERFKVDIVAGDQYSREFARFNRQMGVMSASAIRLGRLVLGAFSVKAVVNFGKELARVQRRFDAIDATFRSVEGSAAGAEAAFDDAAGIANTLGLDLVSTAQSFAQFNAAAKGTALEGDAARDIFESLSIAASALQLDAYDTRGAMRSLEQMISKGNVQAEELRGQLGERLPGAFQLAARAMNVTTSELNDMLENGEVLADDLLPKLAPLLREDYTAGARQGAESLNGDINRLTSSIQRLQAAGSELLQLEEIVEAIGFAAYESAGFLEQMADGMQAIKDSVAVAELAEAQEELRELREEAADFRDRLDAFGGIRIFAGNFDFEELRQAERRVEELQEIVDGFRLDDTKEPDAPALKEVSVPDSMQENAEERSRRLEELNRDLARSLDALRSPAQVAEDEIAKYEAGLAAGIITQEQFNALVLAVRPVFDEFGAWQGEIDKFYDAWDRGRQIIEDLRTPTEEYAADVQELVSLLEQGGLAPVEFQQALQRMGERFAKEQEGGAFLELQNALTSSIIAGVEGGADSALDVFANLLQKMAMEALQSQLSGALANLFPGGGGGGGGGLFGALGGLFGGARADGGSVTGGKTYLVGERGPELFTAGRTGTITPNDAMGGGFTYAPVVTIQGGASEQDRILFQRQLDAQKAELFDLARRGRL